MLLLEGMLLGLLVAVLSGGSVQRLGRLHVRGGRVLIFAFLTQVLVPRLLGSGGIADKYLLAVAWVLPNLIMLAVCLLNWRVPGMLVLATGIALNLLVVVSNAGMPVLLSNAPWVGVSTEGAAASARNSWLHVPLTASSRLALLADVVPVPGPSWQRGLISLGDILLTVGAGYLVFVASHCDLRQS